VANSLGARRKSDHRQLTRRGHELITVVEQFAAFLHQTVGDDHAPLARSQPFTVRYLVDVGRQLEGRHPPQETKWKGGRAANRRSRRAGSRVPRPKAIVETKPALTSARSLRSPSNHIAHVGSKRKSTTLMSLISRTPYAVGTLDEGASAGSSSRR